MNFIQLTLINNETDEEIVIGAVATRIGSASLSRYDNNQVIEGMIFEFPDEDERDDMDLTMLENDEDVYIDNRFDTLIIVVSFVGKYSMRLDTMVN